MKHPLSLKVNGEAQELLVNDWDLLRDVLRDQLSLTGTKEGCTTGDCGACTVLIDGKAVKSCMIFARQAEGHEITTIEGLADAAGTLHPLQQAFIDHFAVQCGFCIPGVILTAKALLDENPGASEAEIKHGLHGNLCRCTGYVKIIEAVQVARDEMNDGRGK